MNKIYFIGIGGIGMSAIARYFKSQDKQVAGYDRTSTSLTKSLAEEGIDIHYDDNVELIPEQFKNKSEIENILIVYTPAIPEAHSELNFFRNNNYTIKKRSQILGITVNNSMSVAVAGTHGKTTISTIVAHLLHNSAVGCSAFLGGIAKNYNSNLLLSNKSDYIVVEADEFDRSFLQLTPQIAVISSVDADHLDIYGNHNELLNTFKQFVSQIKADGTLIVKKSIADKLINSCNSDVKIFTYSLEKKADFTAKNIRIEKGKYCFDTITPFGDVANLKLGLPGYINIENAVAAIAIAKLTGVGDNEISVALQNFEGIKRRFEYHTASDAKTVYIDDYAHHPEEIKATLGSVRKLYPNRKICGIFQPHLFTRTRDFAEGFAQSLSLLDELILTDIYPARELPIEGVTSKIIFDKVTIENKILCRKEEILSVLEKRKNDVVITLGAGDIDKHIEEISKVLIH